MDQYFSTPPLPYILILHQSIDVYKVYERCHRSLCPLQSNFNHNAAKIIYENAYICTKASELLSPFEMQRHACLWKHALEILSPVEKLSAH